MLKLYLDNCCFNRPYDDQSQSKIRSETDAKLLIQEKIAKDEVELVWSFILDYENSLNPFIERKNAIAKWKEYSQIYINGSEELLLTDEEIFSFNAGSGDSLHVASSVIADCDYFITTDDILIRKLKNYKHMKLINPKQFILITEGN